MMKGSPHRLAVVVLPQSMKLQIQSSPRAQQPCSCPVHGGVQCGAALGLRHGRVIGGANGMYHNLYTSPLLPEPNSDAGPSNSTAPGRGQLARTLATRATYPTY